VRRGERAWLVRVPVGRDSTGTRKYHNKTVHGTKQDAQRYLTKVLRELDTGMFVEASQQTLSAFVEEWLRTAVQPRVSRRTGRDYRQLIQRHVLPTLGHRQLSQLTTVEIQGLYTGMMERGLSSRTVRYVHSVLHSALEQAVRWQKLARNPAKLVDLPRHRGREMKVLTAEQAKRFLETAADDRWHALWSLLLASGLRPGEALGLKWSDLDGDRLGVQRGLVRHADGTWELTDPKTRQARRVVTLPPSVVRALQQLRARQLTERLRAGPTWADLDLIFTAREGQPLDYRVLVQRHFKQLLRAAGLPRIRPYDLRHTCATLLLAAGENVKVVSERLGHASAALTLDIYSHVLPHMQQRAAERLEAVLFGSG
jgi:integrase